jgi:hypothetical protein
VGLFSSHEMGERSECVAVLRRREGMPIMLLPHPRGMSVHGDFKGTRRSERKKMQVRTPDAPRLRRGGDMHAAQKGWRRFKLFQREKARKKSNQTLERLVFLAAEGEGAGRGDQEGRDGKHRR